MKGLLPTKPLPPRQNRGPFSPAAPFPAGWLLAGLAALLAVGAARGQLVPAFTTLHHFEGAEGKEPEAGVIQASDGNLYGTTNYAGSLGRGEVYALSALGAATPLHAFNPYDSTDGTSALLHLTQASDGNVYGVSEVGNNLHTGAIFRITLNPRPTYTPFYQFSALTVGTNENSDGASPTSSLASGPDGNLYGLTYAGGASYGAGTFFKITTMGTLTTLYQFLSVPKDGSNPSGDLFLARDGNFYGTASQGGAFGFGTVFRLTPDGVETTLASFTNGAEGGNPGKGVIEGSDGNFYGTIANQTIFQVDASGALNVFYRFSNPDLPQALTLGPDGNFYGVTVFGGAEGEGTIFQLTPAGTLTTVHAFSALDGLDQNSDGGHPTSIYLSPSGIFYGTTSLGGDAEGGTIFALSLRPVITSPASVSAMAGQAISYQTEATNFPTGFSAETLPPGLTLDPASGLLSGAAPQSGEYSIALLASNAFGSGTFAAGATLTLTVTGSPAPAITSALSLQGVATVPLAYQIVATNQPTSYGAAGLPAGLSLDPATGLLSGAPAMAGTSQITLTATNAAGAGAAVLTLTVAQAPPTVTAETVGAGVASASGGPGKVKVSRTGDASAALTVHYTVAGSAQPGAAYEALPGVVTIPAGAAQAKIKIRATPGAAAGGKVKITLNPATDDSYLLGAPAKAKVQIEN